jgi:hypothetical protein
MPDRCGVPVVTNSCVLFFTHEAAGARASGIPCALLEGETMRRPGAKRAAGMYGVVSRSSPGLTGRSSIPETFVFNREVSGMLDAPPEPVIGLAKGETRWRGMTTNYGCLTCESGSSRTRAMQ